MSEPTQQQIVAEWAQHRDLGGEPAWSGDPNEWPVCSACGGEILLADDGEGGPIWCCSDKGCERG